MGAAPERRALWPASEGPTTGRGVDQTLALADRRNWLSGLHGGTRAVVEGRITPPRGGCTMTEPLYLVHIPVLLSELALFAHTRNRGAIRRRRADGR